MRRTIVEAYETTSVIEKRIAYLLGARLRDKGRVKAAMEKQDRIRTLHPAPEHWNSVAEIRKWRDAR